MKRGTDFLCNALRALAVNAGIFVSLHNKPESYTA